MFGRGYIPDPLDYVRGKLSGLLELLGLSGLPDHTENAIDVLGAVPVFDQGAGADGTSACTGHSCSVAIGGRMFLAGAPLGFVPSPKRLYGNGIAIDRGPDGPPLVDSGAQPSQVWRGARTFGISPMVSLAHRFSDCEPATVTEEPRASDLLAESACLAVGEYAIPTKGQVRIIELCNALAAKRPVTAAIQADALPIQRYAGDILTGTMLGTALDHYVCLLDYCTLPDGSRVFLARNSWGAWGADHFTTTAPIPKIWPAAGHFLVDESAVQTMGDLVIADVQIKRAA